MGTTQRAYLAAAVVGLWGLLAGTAREADAALVTYSDRTTFNAAAAPGGGEDFNGFAADTSFRGVSLAISNGTVTGVNGTNGSATNKIDVAPFEFGAFYAIDGTPYLLGDLVNGQAITFDFTTGVTAWGADFRGVADVGRPTRIDVFDAANTLLGSVAMASGPANDQIQFYGFSLTGGSLASRIVILNPGSDNDVFGLDNIAYTTGVPAVPEPASLALAGTGALLLVGAGIRRRRRAAA